jgi:hypothetical protein
MVYRKSKEERSQKKRRVEGRNEGGIKVRGRNTRTKKAILHTGGCRDTKIFVKEVED